MKNIIAKCNQCDYEFNATKNTPHIARKFLIFEYAYIICPRCWNKLVIPEEYEKYFGLTRGL